jgi:hypothetical protein
MDYQVTVEVTQLASWQARLTGLADAHHGQPIEEHLRAVAGEIHAKVPDEWWATQPDPVDNRIRNS